MLKRKDFRRAKVNCLCRCTPSKGIEFLYTKHIQRTLRQSIFHIMETRSTGVIAATALRTGDILENTGHLVPAIKLYRTAMNRIFFLDSCRAEDYYEHGPSPANPHYRYWTERISDADALQVAERLDNLYLRMNMPGEARQQRRVRFYYEDLFNCIYSAQL